MKPALIAFLLTATAAARAGTQFPVAFTKTVCIGDYADSLSALTELNRQVTAELASCTAGVFHGSGSALNLESVEIATHFSHMCSTGSEVMSASVKGTCVIP